MKVTVKNIAVFGAIIALLLFVAATICMFAVGFPSDPKLRLGYLGFWLEVYKAIGIGFLIALLGVLIPDILAETKYEFEKHKEGRKTYSEAKTGIEYLLYDLAELNLVEGIQHLKKVHNDKHMVDIYQSDSPRLYKNWNKDERYEQIKKYRETIGTKAWDHLTRDDRLEKLLKIQKELEHKSKQQFTKS